MFVWTRQIEVVDPAKTSRLETDAFRVHEEGTLLLQVYVHTS